MNQSSRARDQREPATQYQLFDPLREEEYAALKADIAKRGVMVPIEVDEQGTILDGHHRVRACQELGLPSPPSITRIGLDEAGKREHVLKLNLLRRHLGVIQWAEKFRLLAELRGVELGKRGPKPQGANSATVAELAAEVGVPYRTAARRLEWAERLAEEPALKAEVDAGAKSPAEAVREVKNKQRRADRNAKAEALAAAPPLETFSTFGVLYLDPPWRYEHEVSDSRAIENQYPTMALEDLTQLAAKLPAADDALLFCWATSPKLAEAMQLLTAWGFDYRTCMVWVKDKIGMGYYARQQHELLLIAKRGEPPTPEPENRPASVIAAPRPAVHSHKPDVFYELIERMYPDLAKVELFARQQRAGWAAWGNEVPH